MHGPSVIQILLSVIALFAIYNIFTRTAARRMGIMFAAVWFAGALGFLFFVWFPNYATVVSQKIGVGRGVDAALYISVALLFFIVLRILIRLERQEDIMTRLVTEIALLNAEEKKEDLV